MGLTLLVPIFGAIGVIFVNPSRVRRFAGGVALVTTLIAIWLAVLQYGNPPIEVAWPWIGGLGIDFEFHLDGLASILMVAAAALSALAILSCLMKLGDRKLSSLHSMHGCWYSWQQ